MKTKLATVHYQLSIDFSEKFDKQLIADSG